MKYNAIYLHASCLLPPQWVLNLGLGAAVQISNVCEFTNIVTHNMKCTFVNCQGRNLPLVVGFQVR
jgi:hypothetical protein